MSKINIQLLADRVLVEPAAAETKTSSGIIINAGGLSHTSVTILDALLAINIPKNLKASLMI